MSDIIKAVNAGGKEVYVPEHWLDHPVLGKNLRAATETATPERGTMTPENPSPTTETEV